MTLALVAVCVALAWPSSSPLEPVNAGRPGGDTAWAWAFLGSAAAALAAYGLGVLALRRRAARLVTVVVLAAAIQLAPLAAPLLLSTDVWAYWDYGRIATVHDGNPYRSVPADFPGDPAFPYVGAEWRDDTTVYGPAFTLASEPLAAAAGTSADAAAWIYKSLAAVAILVATACAGLLARQKVAAVAFAGWNPLLAIHLAGGGHNDAWVAALVLGAMAFAATGRARLAGVAWALSLLVKWISVLLLPLRALEARAHGRRVDHVGFAVTFVLVAAVATVAYGLGWLEAFGPLARNAGNETRFAIPHRLEQLGVPKHAAVGAPLVAFALAYAWLLREAVRGRARLGLAMGLLLLAVPYLTPWYLAWVVPLAAADEDPPAQLLGFGLSAYLLPQTVPI